MPDLAIDSSKIELPQAYEDVKVREGPLKFNYTAINPSAVEQASNHFSCIYHP